MSKKYTIRLLYDVDGWAYYFRCAALQKYVPEDFDVSIGPDYGKVLKQKPHDLVFQLCYSYAKPLYEQYYAGGSEFNCMVKSAGTPGSLFLTMSGCKITDMAVPSSVEGVSEQTITIVPQHVSAIAFDTITDYNAW